MKKIIECVPNISEGRDPIVIDKVIEVINSNKNVKLLKARNLKVKKQILI